MNIHGNKLRVNTQKKIKTLYGKKSVFDSDENLKKIIELVNFASKNIGKIEN